MANDSLAHNRDAIGNRHRFFLIVGYVNRRDADLALNALDHRAHFHAELRVEVGKRFIHQKYVGE